MATNIPTEFDYVSNLNASFALNETQAYPAGLAMECANPTETYRYWTSQDAGESCPFDVENKAASADSGLGKIESCPFVNGCVIIVDDYTYYPWSDCEETPYAEGQG